MAQTVCLTIVFLLLPLLSFFVIASVSICCVIRWRLTNPRQSATQLEVYS